jgi:ABC-type polysaccharide/polyol phosphate transport system ATPase subunit
MSSDTLLRVEGISKVYNKYAKPSDRLKQMVVPKLRRLVGLSQRAYFEEFSALARTTFELKRGESMGLVGRNGSGKSTMLQIIAGILHPTTGSVQMAGRLSALLELGTGFNPEFTGRENAELSLTLQGFSAAQARDKFDAVAQFADIGDFIDQPLRTYSSGMYARLAFAVAINSEPDLLIVDEILAVGDAPFQQKCLNQMYGMLDAGMSILLVSHDAYQVRALCQKALLLEKGEPRVFGPADKVMDEYVAGFQASVGHAKAVPTEEPASEGPKAATSAEGDQPSEFVVSIQDPVLCDAQDVVATELRSGDAAKISFSYSIHGSLKEDLSFVVNIYREDDVYVFGTTTQMQGLAPYAAGSAGQVTAHFTKLPLLSGKYKCRVAINDGRGMNILAEAVPVCHFSIRDDFQAVGIVDLEHEWEHHPL